jgi:predicted N-acetyltransferase YhbS
MMEGVTVSYRTGEQLDTDAVIDVLRDPTLGERRPIGDRERIARMLAGANLTVSAWEDGEIVGLARSLTDWSYVTYLSDLAVRSGRQRRGIGRALIERTRDAAPEAALVLLAAPASVDYYSKVGFDRHPAAYYLPRPETPAPPAT